MPFLRFFVWQTATTCGVKDKKTGKAASETMPKASLAKAYALARKLNRQLEETNTQQDRRHERQIAGKVARFYQ